MEIFFPSLERKDLKGRPPCEKQPAATHVTIHQSEFYLMPHLGQKAIRFDEEGDERGGGVERHFSLEMTCLPRNQKKKETREGERQFGIYKQTAGRRDTNSISKGQLRAGHGRSLFGRKKTKK